MPEGTGVEEVGRARAGLMDRPLRLVQLVGAVIDQLRILIGIDRRAALRDQSKTARDVGVVAVRNEARAEDLGVVHLPDRGGTRLVHGRLRRTRSAGAPAELELVASEGEARGGVRRSGGRTG